MKKGEDEMRVLSLGWGVQSWTIAAMAAMGDIPPVDVLIHADTGWEREETYAFASHMAPWLEERGVAVVTVSSRSSQEIVDGGTKVHAPVFSKLDEGRNFNPASTSTPSGRGQLKRQCTNRWKIQPLRRYIRAVLRERGVRNPPPGSVTMLLGITTDEWTRVRDSDVKYIVHSYPLLDMGMSRQDCIAWLASHDLPVPAKSSCVFCPYHNQHAWGDMAAAGGSDWEIACQVDESIREKRPPYSLYVHPSCRPLREIGTVKQLDFFDDAIPCDGHCFL
jgi:hypothetical protein